MDQIGFKINFKKGKKVMELTKPLKRYEACKHGIDDITLLRGELITNQ